ncbi:MAG: DUF4149 domain-containing protein [Nitrospira sp.]|nr:DUF4149 domain-containing protein [Nitrospira sp.]
MVIVRFLHLLSLVTWIGGMIFLVTIGAPSIFKVLPRETAGDVFGDIFPRYWIMGYICSITALATITIISINEQVYPWERIGLLAFMTVLTFFLGLVLAARTRKIRLQIRAEGDTPQRGIMTKKFRKIHNISVSLNVIILIAGIAVLFLSVG